jgi:hypothetical protein
MADRDTVSRVWTVEQDTPVGMLTGNPGESRGSVRAAGDVAADVRCAASSGAGDAARPDTMRADGNEAGRNVE